MSVQLSNGVIQSKETSISYSIDSHSHNESKGTTLLQSIWNQIIFRNHKYIYNVKNKRHYHYLLLSDIFRFMAIVKEEILSFKNI